MFSVENRNPNFGHYCASASHLRSDVPPFLPFFIVFVLWFLLEISIITFVIEHQVHPMAGEHQESHVNIPASLEPVVVLVDGVGLHLHIDLLILQLGDLMNCLRGKTSEYHSTVC